MALDQNYNLYFLPSNKFKTVTLSLYLRCKKKKEDAVYSEMLTRMLLAGTGGYTSLSDYNREKLNLYNPFIDVITYFYGKERLIVLIGQFVCEKYTEKKTDEQNIKFILDTLYNPKVNNQSFDKDIFEQVKTKYISDLKLIKTDAHMYSLERLYEEMGFFDMGILDKVKLAATIDEKKLYKYYESLFETNSLDVFVSGDMKYEKIESLFYGLIKGNFIQNGPSKVITNHNPILKVKEIRESSSFSQSSLIIGLQFSNLTEFERKYVSIIYIGILGGFWNSLLMDEVREKRGLCYSIYASRDISTSSAYIYAGIDFNNYEEVYAIILKQLESMKNGDFDDELIDQNKKIYYSSLVQMEDEQVEVVNNFASEVLACNDEVRKRYLEIDKVTKKDLMKFAKKVYCKVVFVLKGDGANE